jgi:hypothetical protein
MSVKTLVKALTFMDDPFGMSRVSTIMILEMLEAWTPEKKDEIVKAMADRANLVDHVVIGDYDLVLWHYREMNEYAASINSGQEDPTTVIGQKRRPPAGHVDWYDVVSQLQTWVRQHGRILIGSTVKERTNKYRRLLNRHFLIGEWTDHPNAGFFILPD